MSRKTIANVVSMRLRVIRRTLQDARRSAGAIGDHEAESFYDEMALNIEALDTLQTLFAYGPDGRPKR